MTCMNMMTEAFFVNRALPKFATQKNMGADIDKD